MKQRISVPFGSFFFVIFFLQILRASADVTVYVQPGSETVSVGQRVVFGAIAITSGGEVITGYQWFMSPTSQGPFTSVGQAASLVLNNVQVSDAGYYYANVTYQGVGGTHTLSTALASLTVNVQPNIVIQPVGGLREPGSNVTFSVTAAGVTPLYYQWRHNYANLLDD